MNEPLKIIARKRLEKRTLASDPLDVNVRLYQQMHHLLTQLEDPDAGIKVTMRERVQALIAIGRLQIAFVSIRKEKSADEPAAGASVRKYAAAFANDARRRTARSRPGPEPDEGFGFDDEDGDTFGDDDSAA